MGDYFNIFTALLGVAGTFAVLKYQSNENKRQLEKHDEDQNNMFTKVFEKIDKHGEEIVALKTKQEANITAKEVHEQYISRELFEMHKQHIDYRFDKIDGTMGKILDAIEKLGGK